MEITCPKCGQTFVYEKIRLVRREGYGESSELAERGRR
jgi:hypothetical protein